MLSVHSAKALIVEKEVAPNQLLANSIIQLAMAKGTRHEVRCITATERVKHWVAVLIRVTPYFITMVKIQIK